MSIEASRSTSGKDERKKNDIVSNSSIVSSYLNSLHSLKQLKHPELVELFKVFEGPDAAASAKARKILVECNLRLVVSIAKTYKGYNMPFEDILQEGNVGLMKAVERFKWQKGFRFSTYATWWIRQAIGQHVLKTRRTIRLPAHAVTVQRKLVQATKEYREMMGCEPTEEELMALVPASETVVKATMHAGKNTVSLSQPAWLGCDDESELGDKIEDEGDNSDPFRNVAEKELMEVVKGVMQGLSTKEAVVLRLRFGLCEDATNSDAYPITDEEVKGIMQGKGMVDG